VDRAQEEYSERETLSTGQKMLGYRKEEEYDESINLALCNNLKMYYSTPIRFIP
jgi:hypothetical protein